MNYGYEPNTPGYEKKKELELARRLGELCLEYGTGKKFEGGPYIEVGGLYPGIRIRKITNLSEAKREELVKKADAIYLEVMCNGNPDKTKRKH